MGFQEPWTYGDDRVVRDAAGRQVTDQVGAILSGHEEEDEFMQRIVACVNFCAGFSTEYLEEYVASREPGAVLAESPAGVIH
jgi:hypothetical protein